MRFFDRFLNRSSQNADRAATEGATRVTKTKSLIEQVYDAPALFNRKTRRAVGILSKVWRWDTRGTDMARTFVPRYVRRHHAHAFTTPTTTRRVRKQRARIRAAIARTNLTGDKPSPRRYVRAASWSIEGRRRRFEGQLAQVKS